VELKLDLVATAFIGRLSYNCTNVELKLRLVWDNFQKFCAYNCTNVELKHVRSVMQGNEAMSL